MFVSASSKSSLLKPEVKDKLLLLWKQELRPHIGFDHVICSKHVYEIQSSDDSQVLMFVQTLLLSHKIKPCCFHHIFSLFVQNEMTVLFLSNYFLYAEKYYCDKDQREDI